MEPMWAVVNDLKARAEDFLGAMIECLVRLVNALREPRTLLGAVMLLVSIVVAVAVYL